MAKFVKADEEIQDMVQEVASELGLDNFIDFEALYVAKMKDTVVNVCKASAIAEYFAEKENIVLVIIYAEAFDMVDDATKKMWIRMAMDQVNYDSEKDAITIGVPTISTPYGFYLKYKDEAIKASELALLTLQQIADKKAQEKEEKKNKKKKKE